MSRIYTVTDKDGNLIFSGPIRKLPFNIESVDDLISYCERFGHTLSFGSAVPSTIEVDVYCHGSKEDDTLLDAVDPHELLSNDIRRKLQNPLYEVQAHIVANPSGEYVVEWLSLDGGKTKYVKDYHQP